MRPWSAVVVPTLPGTGQQISLFDSRDGKIRPTTPGPVATMYVCGITPYDAAHIGHAATYVAFDLLARAWMDAGHEVHYVQNVTDIDDPLLVRAAETGVDWQELATKEIGTFLEDMAMLRLVPPREYIGAVESIPLIVDYVKALRDAGAVYVVDGDLYFRVHADDEFGSISHLTREQMLAVFGERGGDPDRAGKEDPLDCLLWVSERPGEPSWDSDLGPGRPGWHIECVAIAVNSLGMSFDVQGGGSDLTFPHHEMGAAEAHIACDKRPYARHYVHAGMVALDGEKMSKSRGNLVFVHQLRAQGVDLMAIRLAILSQHYRSDWEWTPALLDEGAARLEMWRRAVALPSGPDAGAALADVRARLADDLDAPGALAVIDAWCESAVAGASRATATGFSHEASPEASHEASPEASPEASREVSPGASPGANANGASVLIRDAVDALLGVAL